MMTTPRHWHKLWCYGFVKTESFLGQIGKRTLRNFFLLFNEIFILFIFFFFCFHSCHLFTKQFSLTWRNVLFIRNKFSDHILPSFITDFELLLVWNLCVSFAWKLNLCSFPDVDLICRRNKIKANLRAFELLPRLMFVAEHRIRKHRKVMIKDISRRFLILASNHLCIRARALCVFNDFFCHSVCSLHKATAVRGT